MRGYMGLTKRNLLIYFKDIQSVIFSLLTSIIVFVLYLIFLKGTFVDAIDDAMRGLESIVKPGDVETFVNGLLLTGIMGSAIITVPYSCLTTIVRDRENKIDYDISATPIKRWMIILSYFTASVISAFMITAVIFTAGLIIMSQMGNVYLTVKSISALYAVIALGSISSTAFFMIVVLFFKSTSASSAFFGMLAAASGFVIGAYIPVSQFSDIVQTVCNIFPASHITVMIRKLILSDVLEKMNTDINGLDNGMFTEVLREIFSFNANMNGNGISTVVSLVYVGVFAVVSIAIMIFLYGKTYRRK